MMLPSKEELNERYDYDPITGILSFKTHREPRYVGQPVGCTDSYGYLVTAWKGKIVKVHRLIWKMVYGEDPDTVDHINENKQDNRLSNLQSVSSHLNASLYFQRREDLIRVSNTYTITYHKATAKWQLSALKPRRYIGVFDSIQDAEEWFRVYGDLKYCDTWDGKTGVYWHKRNNKFIVTCPPKFGRKHLGYTETKEEGLLLLKQYLSNMEVCICPT